MEQICSYCSYRIIGQGCTKTNVRVTDHDTCEEWEAIKRIPTPLERDAVEQYRQAGYTLELEG